MKTSKNELTIKTYYFLRRMKNFLIWLTESELNKLHNTKVIGISLLSLSLKPKLEGYIN
jgi:hypothetical protein